MIGVMRADGSVGGRWERHDGGDELLVLMAGRCTVTVRRPDGRTRSIMSNTAMCC
jgi:hypothetical protein